MNWFNAYPIMCLHCANFSSVPMVHLPAEKLPMLGQAMKLFCVIYIVARMVSESERRARSLCACFSMAVLAPAGERGLSRRTGAISDTTSTVLY